MDKSTLELLQGYLAKAKEKLEVGERLYKAGDYEDAVSRAYYAAFHATQALLLTEGLSADTHHGLVSLFGLHFAKTGKIDRKFGRYLSNLKEDREKSDYNVYSDLDQHDAEQALQEAREFVAESQRYIQPLLPQ